MNACFSNFSSNGAAIYAEVNGGGPGNLPLAQGKPCLKCPKQFNCSEFSELATKCGVIPPASADKVQIAEIMPKYSADAHRLAKLFAAAPDLLDACRDALTSGTLSDETANLLAAAIDKAEV